MSVTNRLTDLDCKKALPRTEAFKLSDGGGLKLLVKPNGTKLWQYRFKIGGTENVYSIGMYPAVTLKKAREDRDDARDHVAAGRNPTTARNEAKRLTIQAEQLNKENTFRALFNEWQELKQGLSKGTLDQRRREVEVNLASLLSRPMVGITRVELNALLKPIKKRAPEVARNLRQYLQAIFELAIDGGLLMSNPVPTSKIIGRKAEVHHKALLGELLGNFVLAVTVDDRHEQKTRVAIQLTLLTVCRKCEVTAARWEEFDFAKGIWHIPAERMKTRLPHVVALSEQALALINDWRATCGNPSIGFLFPNRRSDNRPMAGRSLNALMADLGFGKEGTPHGLRTAFSTHFNSIKESSDVIERCLAHRPKDKIRAAYNLWEYFPERKTMLQAWGDQVVQLRLSAESRCLSMTRASVEQVEQLVMA